MTQAKGDFLSSLARFEQDRAWALDCWRAMTPAERGEIVALMFEIREENDNGKTMRQRRIAWGASLAILAARELDDELADQAESPEGK